MASREELEKKISADLSKEIDKRTNLQGIQNQKLEGMIELQRYMKGQIMFLYQIVFLLMEDLEPKLETSLSYALAENLEEFLKNRKNTDGVHPIEISALEEGLALLRIRFQHPPKPDQ